MNPRLAVLALVGLGGVALIAPVSTRIKSNKQERIAIPQAVYQVPAFELHIVTQEEMERVYRNSGMRVPPGHVLEGFTGTAKGKRVVFMTQPQYRDDNVTTTLGHEVLHITHGNYHK